MKEISLYIRPEDFSKVVDILRKNNVGGITFFETNGSGRTKHKPVPERVRMYMTGKMVTPEFVKGTKVEVIVPDSSVDQIVEDILDNLDRKSTRLNSSHSQISYAVFCLKKKISTTQPQYSIP